MSALLRPRHSGCRGQYKGSDILRLAVLKYAAVLGAPYVDVEYLAAEFFFASRCSMYCSHNKLQSGPPLPCFTLAVQKTQRLYLQRRIQESCLLYLWISNRSMLQPLRVL